MLSQYSARIELILLLLLKNQNKMFSFATFEISFPKLSDMKIAFLNIYGNSGLKIIAVLFFILAHTVISESQTVENISSVNAFVSHWIENNFTKGKVPAFPFLYGGKNSDTFISVWQL